MNAAPQAPPDPVAQIVRWEQFGGLWRVLYRQHSSIHIALCRCDNGEEVERLVSDDPALDAWLDGRTGNDEPPREV